MAEPGEDDRFAQVLQRVEPHGKLVRTWKLEGGVSAQVTVLDNERANGLRQRLIVRRHGAMDLQHSEGPRIAAGEFKLLQLLHRAGLPVPEPHYLDESGTIFAAPYLVLEYIEGSTEFAPADLGSTLIQMATHLSSIHQLNCLGVDLSFLPRHADTLARKLGTRPALLDESLRESCIRDVLESAWPLPQRNRSALLHGDFWPGNILWRQRQLVGVIDWEDAAIGDPLADLANSRLEILWAYGDEAMQRFTHNYQAMTALDFTDLPFWDLFAALRPASRLGTWAGDDITEQKMRAGHRLFVSQALTKLSSR